MPFTARLKSNYFSFFFIILTSFLIFYHSGYNSLVSWDEAFYANVSQHIYKNGNFIDLYYQGSIWADKPPLYFWITAFFFKIFGITEFSARLLSMLSGIGLLIVVYFIGKEIFSRKEGILAVIFLLGTYQFLYAARMGTLDITFLFFSCLGIFAFLKADKNKKYLMIFTFSFFCAFMTKSFALFPFVLLVFFYALFTKKLSFFRNRYFLLSFFLFLIPVFSWHFLAFKHYGKFFLQNYFIKNLFGRSLKAIEQHPGGFFFYFKVIFNKGRFFMPPALIFFPFFAWDVYHKEKKRDAFWIIVAWVAAVFSVYTIVKTKLNWYILPIYPALAISFAYSWNKLFKKASIIAALICLSGFLPYFIYKKKLFLINENKHLKSISCQLKSKIGAKGKIFLFNVLDPAVQFYFFNQAENISQKEAIEGEKTLYVICAKGNKGCQSLIKNGFTQVLQIKRDIVALKRK